jgi:hypothetical protein
MDDQAPRPKVMQDSDSEVKQQVAASAIVCTSGENLDPVTKVCTIENQVISLVKNYFFENDDVKEIFFKNT